MHNEKIVLAVDLDGTLVHNDENEIHPRDIEILRAGLPFPLILATGRSLASTRYPFEKNGLLDGQPLPYPLVLNNGALLFSPNEEPEAVFPFADEVAAEMIRIASGYKDATFLLQSIPEVYQLGETESGLRAVRKYGYAPIRYRPGQGAVPLTKLMVLSDRRQDLDAMAAAFAHLPVEGIYSLNDIYELSPVGVNKGEGLKRLLDILGWSDVKLIAVGDGENDASMFSLADYSFAPLNGRDYIREMADSVIDPRLDGLLAPILERIY